MYDLSVIIPGKNEEFIGVTAGDVLQNIEGNTQIVVVLDGFETSVPDIPNDPRVKVLKFDVSLGQRAATNRGVGASDAKYVMKLDAHCAVDKGFDVKMLGAFKEIGDDVTMIPTLYNLHAFNWRCKKCGKEWYQGLIPEHCKVEENKQQINNLNCDNMTDFEKVIVWKPRLNRKSEFYRFDTTLHFQYAGVFKSRPEIMRGILLGYELSLDPQFVSPGVIGLFANLTSSHPFFINTDYSGWGKDMAVNAVCFSPINNGGGVRAVEIFTIGDKFKMQGITTGSVFTKMVNDGDIFSSPSGNFTKQPSIDKAVGHVSFSKIDDISITKLINSADPVPTPSSSININVVEEFNNIFGGRFIYNEKSGSLHNGSVLLTPIYCNDFVETMSIQGSCFMCTKQKYNELNLCDETWGSWGNQGTEVACKTWLSGGRVVTNRRTWYSHMFRTQGGSFGFPYHQSGNEVERARKASRDLFLNNKWEKQIYPLSWLVEKFKPVPIWHDPEGKDMLDFVNKKGKQFYMQKSGQFTKEIIFYTDNQLDLKVAEPVRNVLKKISREKGIPIVCSSLKRMDFGDTNIHFPSMKRGYLAMFKQILGALENSTADIIFFAEHDVLYHPSHFDFTPPDKNTYYYNQNVWFLRMPDGHALHYDVNQLSGLCAYRDVLITHFRERYEMVKQEFDKGFPEADFVKFVRNIGFEPMTHNRIQWKNWFKYETWKSEYPNVDIKHGANATGQRWNKDQYRNQQLLVNWTESEEIPGWGRGIDVVSTLQ